MTSVGVAVVVAGWLHLVIAFHADDQGRLRHINLGANAPS